MLPGTAIVFSFWCHHGNTGIHRRWRQKRLIFAISVHPVH